MKPRLFTLATLLVLLAGLGTATAWSGTGARVHNPATPDRTAGPSQPAAIDAFDPVFLQPDPLNVPQAESVTAIDPSGGVHVAFGAETSDEGGSRPAYYAYCPSGCNEPADWTVIPVGDLGLFGEGVTLALTAAGRPRMMWFFQDMASGGGIDDGVYRYAECDAGCTDPGNWGVSGDLAVQYVGPSSVHYFALDPQGRPRFVYLGDSPRYVTCDADCTDAANWHDYATDAPGTQLYNMHLAINPAGQPRLLSFQTDNYVDYLIYSECNGGCGVADNWSGTRLFELGELYNAYALRLDGQGRPRVALYTAVDSGTGPEELLFYTWSDADFTDPASWQVYGVGLPASYGGQVDLALDADGRPHVAYVIDDIPNSLYGLGYAKCTADCESAAAAWEAQVVETVDDLNASHPIPITLPCTISSWTDVGKWPGLAVDADDAPHIGYYTKHMQSSLDPSSSCYLETDAVFIRYAGGAGGGNGGGEFDRFVYLPVVERR